MCGCWKRNWSESKKHTARRKKRKDNLAWPSLSYFLTVTFQEDNRLSSRPGRFQTDIKSGWATREGTCRSHPSFLSSLVWDVTCGSIAVGSDEKGTVDSGFDPTARQGMFFNIFPAFLLQDL